jgi:hypothetical protein
MTGVAIKDIPGAIVQNLPKGLNMTINSGQKLSGKHHKFCVYTFENWVPSVHKPWNCICRILEAYDKWRKKNKEV